MVYIESVLIASSSDKGNESLSQLLKSTAYTEITIAHNGGEARRILNQAEFDLVIVIAPLSDEFGHDLCIMLSNKSTCGIILIVKNEIADDISAKVEVFGIFVVPRPLNKQFFYQALKLLETSRKRIIGLKDENTRLQTKIDDIRLIDRSKCVLIQYLGMTEQQAHRYIEKQAMDMRLSRKEIAEGILKTYEA